MNQKAKETLSTNRLLDKPVYTEEDLKALVDKLMFIKKETKAWNIIKQIRVLNFNPDMFEGWAYLTNDDYDYKEIFYEASLDRLPLIMNEDLDSIEEIVFNWRLERSK